MRFRTISANLACVIAAVASLSCGETSQDNEDSAVTCCTCLVNVGCVEASEYEFCKDTLASGGSLQLSGLRDATCNDDACVEADQCATPNNGGGPTGDSSSAEPPGATDPEPPESDDYGDYVVTVESADYAGGDLNGLAWDTAASDEPPDCYISVRINGESIGKTSVAYDTYHPTWNDTFNISVGPRTVLSFRFFDWDKWTDADYGGEYTVVDLGSAIDNGGASVSLSGIAVESFTFSIRRR